MGRDSLFQSRLLAAARGCDLDAVASEPSALPLDRVSDPNDAPAAREKLLGGVPFASAHTHILAHGVFWLVTSLVVVAAFFLILAAFRWLQR